MASLELRLLECKFFDLLSQITQFIGLPVLFARRLAGISLTFPEWLVWVRG